MKQPGKGNTSDHQLAGEHVQNPGDVMAVPLVVGPKAGYKGSRYNDEQHKIPGRRKVADCFGQDSLFQ